MGETTDERERMRERERELDRLLAEDGYGVRLFTDDLGNEMWELWELMDSRDGWVVGHFDTPEEVCEFVGIYA